MRGGDFFFGKKGAPRAQPDGERRPARTLPELLAAHEKFLISETLRRNGSSRSLAARVLGISPRRLYRRMRALGVEVEAPPPRGRPMRKLQALKTIT